MTLGEKQQLFARLLAEWILWVLAHDGWAVRFGEGRILPLGPDNEGRRARLMDTGAEVHVRDAVHRHNSLHYVGLAVDMQLFVAGAYVTNSDNVAWVMAGAQWESMNPYCRWGGRFGDGNHLSIEHEGVA